MPPLFQSYSETLRSGAHIQCNIRIVAENWKLIISILERKKNVNSGLQQSLSRVRHCNGKKSNTWPSKAELAAGCRFLNPCEEMDYGEQIFEDPLTNRLVGITPAAIWHIRICALNSDG